MNEHRLERVADLVHRLLARLLQEQVRDPRIGFVTLTEVKVSPDMHHARVFVTILGEQDRAAAVEALNHAAPFLRRLLAREARLRYTPALRFVYDDAEERGQRVEHALREVHQGQEHPGDPAGEEPSDPLDERG